MSRTGRPKVERVQVPCSGCGTMQERRATDIARSKTGRVFCSLACRDAIGCKPRRGHDRTCEVCGAAFYDRPGGQGRFCSVACHNKGQTKDRIERVCEHCGAAFSLRPSGLTWGAGRFCSRRCDGASRRKWPLDRMHNGRPALLTNYGYVKVYEPDHPKTKNGYVLEHRLIVETILGRTLRSNEHVHHKNRDRTDNRPENLEVMSSHDHCVMTGYDRALREKAERDALQQELEAYRDRFGPLT